MNKQLQTNSDKKKNKRIIPLFFTLTLALASMMGMAQTAYITNYNDNTVSVINVATNTVINTIKVSSNPYGVSASPDGSKVYVTNYGDSTVSVINTATNAVSATITVGVKPAGICVNPDGSKVYVANTIDGTVSVINASTNTVSTNVKIGVSPWGVCVSPDGNKVYVTGNFNQEISSVNVINTVADTVSRNIYLAYNPHYGVTISPDGNKLYITNNLDSTVSVMNTDTIAIDTIKVGFQPIDITMSPDGSKLYVIGSIEQQVYLKNYLTNVGEVKVINTATHTISSTIITDGTFPSGISVSSDGSNLYVVNSGDNIVSVINIASKAVTATIAVGNRPIAFGNFISTHKAVGIPAYSIDAASISLYPNPATNQLTIHASGLQNDKAVTVSIMNVLGMDVSTPLNVRWSLSEVEVDVSQLPAGMYFLQFKTESGSVVKKFVKSTNTN